VARTVPKSLLEILPESGSPQPPDGSPHGVEPTQATDVADGAGGDDGRHGQPARRRRRLPRWWFAVAGAAAVVATAVALPVRSTIAVNELHRLDRRWAWYEALDAQRDRLEAQLGNEAQDVTDPRVRHGRAALEAEEAPLLLAARSALLAGHHLPDAGLHRLRLAMAAAFADRATDLEREAGAGAAARGGAAAGAGRVPGAVAGPTGDQRLTTLALIKVVGLLNAELGRWQQQTVKRPVPAPRLAAADRELAELAQPADQPIDARLIVAGPAGTLTTVDLGRASGRPVTRRPALAGNPLTGPIVARAGYVAIDAETTPVGTNLVYAMSPDIAGPPHVIGSTVGGVVVPAADPVGVWLQSGDSAVEVNAAGASLQGPIPIGQNRTLVGATDHLLVTTGPASSQPTSDLQVVPLAGPQQGHPSVLATRGQLVAAAPGHMAWLDRGGDGAVVIRLADGAARGVRTVAPPILTGVGPSPPREVVPRALPVDTGAFSPQGTRLVLRSLTVSSGATDVQLTVIDTITGAVRLIDGSIGDHPAGPIVWSPSGDQVFFIDTTGAFRATAQVAYIGAWQVDAARPTAIRLSIQHLLAFTVTVR
jgi:hypothetical protein